MIENNNARSFDRDFEEYVMWTKEILFFFSENNFWSCSIEYPLQHFYVWKNMRIYFPQNFDYYGNRSLISSEETPFVSFFVLYSFSFWGEAGGWEENIFQYCMFSCITNIHFPFTFSERIYFQVFFSKQLKRTCRTPCHRPRWPMNGGSRPERSEPD